MLVGLSGYGRSGKDTVGTIFTLQHHFKIVAFADLMRDCAKAIDPIVGWYSDRPCESQPTRYTDLLDQVGYDRAKENPEVRQFLQRIGTEMGRKLFGDDFWVEQTLNKIMLDSSVRDWVITDVRFKNEARAIKDHHGYVVRIHRPGIGPANDHISERDLDDWNFDYHIRNGLGLEELALAANEVLVRASADLLSRHVV